MIGAELESNAEGVRRLAEDRLRKAPYSAVRALRCNFGNGVLTLHGRLHSYYLKQYAQEVVAPIEAVCTVDNQIEVAERDAGSGARIQ